MNQKEITIQIVVLLILSLILVISEIWLLKVLIFMLIIITIYLLINSILKITQKYERILTSFNIFEFKENNIEPQKISTISNDSYDIFLNAIENNNSEIVIRNYKYSFLKIKHNIFVKEELYSKLNKNFNIRNQLYVGYIKTDNFNESTEILNDDQAWNVNNEIIKLINQFFRENEILGIKISDKYWTFIFNGQEYQKMLENNFQVIKDVPKVTAELGAEVTISIGIAHEKENNLVATEELAEAALKLADSRGGSQLVSDINGKIAFFGGKQKVFEKRSKVRVRAFSSALKNQILDANNVIIMGHKSMDMDAFSSAIGIHAIVRSFDKDAKIIINKKTITYDVARGIDYLKKESKPVINDFIFEHVGSHQQKNSLLIIVDTSSYELVEVPEILNSFEKTIIIDHHILNEDSITNTTVSYVETYASSTAEIVTEIFNYIDELSTNTYTATLLLAGIMVDTRNFIHNTGTRTFEAAAFLRSKGALVAIAQGFARDNFDSGQKISQLVGEAKTYQKDFVILTTNEILRNSMAAKIADQLNLYDDTKAAFVIGYNASQGVIISARSKGEIVVHKIIEQLGGGGHISMAAAQIENSTPKQVEKKLKNLILKYIDKEQ